MAMAAPTTEEKAPVPAKAEPRRLRFPDAFDIFDSLREEMMRLWGQRPLMTRPASRPLAEGVWTPRIDVFEKNGNLVIKAELPGVNKEDIKVELREGDLVIEAERKAESEVKEDDYYRIERAYGSLYRRLPMPFEVKPEQVNASYKDGVLEVRIPKPASLAPQAKKIEVR